MPRSPVRRFGHRPGLDWVSGDEFQLDGVTYACRAVADLFPSTERRFCLRKSPAEARRYERYLRELDPDFVWELGIYDGGSTALIAQLARPRKLVAVDIGEPRSAGLSRFVAERGLEDSVRPHWGVDQADRERLARLATEELGPAQLDLVIDDASHLLGPTRDSFEVLFPLLRPGGAFVIEDWGWAHVPNSTWPDVEPLTTLIWELVAATSHRPDVFAEVAVDDGWCVVRRGPAPLDATAGFSVRELCGERARRLLDEGACGG